jgi:hypothetical protein
LQLPTAADEQRMGGYRDLFAEEGLLAVVGG